MCLEAHAVLCCTARASCCPHRAFKPAPPNSPFFLELQDALALLRTLCALRWQPALSALFARLPEQQLDPLQLLSELFAAPPGAAAADVQLAAVQNATTLLTARAGASKKRSAGGRCTACPPVAEGEGWEAGGLCCVPHTAYVGHAYCPCIAL